MAASDGEPQAATKEAEQPKIEPLRLPTPEEIRGQDIWNNCAVRSVVSGIMGTLLLSKISRGKIVGAKR